MTAIKTIGRSGQVSLDKEFAGRQVLLDQIEPGVWLLKLGTFIADSERWLREPEVASAIDEAVAWAEGAPPASSDVTDLARRLEQP